MAGIASAILRWVQQATQKSTGNASKAKTTKKTAAKKITEAAKTAKTTTASAVPSTRAAQINKLKSNTAAGTKSTGVKSATQALRSAQARRVAATGAEKSEDADKINLNRYEAQRRNISESIKNKRALENNGTYSANRLIKEAASKSVPSSTQGENSAQKTRELVERFMQTSAKKAKANTREEPIKNALDVRNSIETNKNVNPAQVQQLADNGINAVKTDTATYAQKNGFDIRNAIETNKMVPSQEGKDGDSSEAGPAVFSAFYTPSLNIQRAVVRTVGGLYDWLNENSGDTSALPALAAAQKGRTDEDGVDPVRDFMTKYEESLDRDLAKLGEKVDSYVGDSAVKKYAYETVAAVGQVVYDLGLILLGGLQAKGVAAIASGGAKLAEAATKIVDSLRSIITQPITFKRAIETFWATRDESEAEGATREEANQRAIFMAFVMPISEGIGGPDAAARAFALGVKSIGKAISFGAASEYLEEIGQGMINAMSRIFYDEDIPLFSTTDQKAIINPLRDIRSGSQGAIVGGLGGGMVAGTKGLLQSVQPKTEETISEGASLPSTDGGLSSLAQNGHTVNAVQNGESEPTANVLTSINKSQPSLKSRAQSTYRDAKRRMVDSAEAITRVEEQTGNKGLYAAFNNAKQATASADNMVTAKQRTRKGAEIGEGLNEIFAPIFKRGDGYVSDFYGYLYHAHNIDRMAQGKPVFGESVSADMSKQEAATLLQKHPEFAEHAEKIYQYERGLMQWRVDSGIYSAQDAEMFQSMYPRYVPTHRDISGDAATYGDIRDIKQATGSNIDLLPIYEQLVSQTRTVVRNARMNDFGRKLTTSADSPSANDLVIRTRNNEQVGDIAERIDNESDNTVDDASNNYIVWVDGNPVTLGVNDDVKFALDNLGKTFNDNVISLTAKKSNEIFKRLVTSYSPTFLARNFMRDVQDGVFYSKQPIMFAKNIPNAMQQIARNTELYQQYTSMGATQSSFFDYDASALLYKQHSGIRKNTIDRIEQANIMIEQVPRFSEFISTLQKHSDGPVKSLSDFTLGEVQEAMYNAADVTVNFGRSGTWGRAINSYAVPFFNASVQGTSKAIRTVTQSPTDVKAWGALILRMGLLAVPASIVNYIIYEDDEDYDAVPNRDKNLYFLIKTEDEDGNVSWVKIPKGRVTGVIGSMVTNIARVAGGEDFDSAFSGFGATLEESVAPINPVTNTLWAGADAAFRTGKTWYGSDIEPQSLTGYSPGQRYDADTTSLAKTIGAQLDFSPKKIDYLMDAYGGAIYDVISPYLTPTSKDGYFANAFTKDAAYTNKYPSEFYDLKETITYEKNDRDGESDSDSAIDVVYKYINHYATIISGLNGQIRDIENSDLSDEEKRTQTREFKLQINALAQSVVEKEEEYRTAAETYLAQTGDTDTAYVYANRDIFGVDYALENYPNRPNLLEDAQAASASTGIDKWEFAETYITISGFSSSKDANGEAIEGQAKKDKVIAYLTESDLTDDQKDYIFYDVMGYTRNSVVDWGATQDIDYDNMTTMEFLDSISGGGGQAQPQSTGTSAADSGQGSTLDFINSLEDGSYSSVTRPVSGRITATYGQKGDLWPSGSHHGVDFSAAVGTDCKVVQGGTVTKTARNYSGSLYGNRIEVTHSDGTTTTYSHLSEIDVSPGDEVTGGQVIGKTGDTGNTDGPHLHFEVIVDGQLVDPQDYYSFN